MHSSTLLQFAIGLATASAAALPVSLSEHLDAPGSSGGLAKRMDDWYEAGRDAGESSQCRYETRMKGWCEQSLGRLMLDGTYGAYGAKLDSGESVPDGVCATQSMGLRGVSVGCKIFFAGSADCVGSGQNMKDGVGQIRAQGMDVCGIKHFTGYNGSTDCALKIDYVDSGC